MNCTRCSHKIGRDETCYDIFSEYTVSTERRSHSLKERLCSACFDVRVSPTDDNEESK